MQSTTEKRRRSVHVIFLISIIINFALALNAYVNSTFLTGITGSKSLVSLIFTGGSILAVIGLAFIPLVLRRFGNYATTLTITVLGAVVFLGLSLLQSPVLIVLSFLVYLVVSSLLYYNIDLLLEHFSKNSTTGGMRGAFLSVSALAFLAGPFVAGFILGENEYWKIYLATAILFVLAIPVFVRSFKTYKDPVYDRTPFWKTLREIYQHQDMRKLFSIYFLLRFFYAWMIIYTPIYLNEFVGLSWTTIGIIFSIMLLPFVLLEYPLGKMADTKLGEKEIIRFCDAMELFIKTRKGHPNHSSLVSQSRTLNRLFPVSSYLHEITNQDIESFTQTRLREGVKNSTIKHIFNLIRGTWKYGRKMGYRTSELVFPTLKLPKHRLRYLSLDEEKRLLTELNPKREINGLTNFGNRSAIIKQLMQDNYDLVVMLLDTGARYSEIATIGWESIDLDTREIRLWRPKVKNESVLFMSERVYRILQRRIQYTKFKYIFTNKKGGPRNHATIGIRKAMKRAALDDCTVHTLRHTHATRLIQNGLSIYEVKEILGHTDITTTMRYSHLEIKDVSSKARDVIDRINEGNNKPSLKVIR